MSVEAQFPKYSQDLCCNLRVLAATSGGGLNKQVAYQANHAWFPEKMRKKKKKRSFFNSRNRAVNPLNGLIRFMTRYLWTEDEQVTVLS